jgi:purine-nucleoside phosphorylase
MEAEEHPMKEGFGERVLRAAAAIPSGPRPRTAVVLGSGLSGIVDRLACSDPKAGSGLKAGTEGKGGIEVPFSSIPEFPRPTVAGHRGILRLSERAAVLAGRFHYYEGHPLDDVVLPVFVLRELGVETLILTNAAGGVNPAYAPGDLVLIKDHINYMGANAFVGPNPERPDGTRFGGARGSPAPAGTGERFFDMSEVYSGELRAAAREAARGIPDLAGKGLAEGVYMAFSGPSYETPAEVRMARAMGADLVGMSTAPEATAARFLGMRVLGLSCVTNMAAGVASPGGEASRLSHEEVVAVGKRAEAALGDLLLAVLDRI